MYLNRSQKAESDKSGADRKGEASRLISSKSFWINDQIVTDPRREMSKSDVFDGHLILLKCAKSRMVIYVDFD